MTRAMTWLEFPIAERTSSSDRLRPKYAINGNSVVMYSQDKAYVGLADPQLAADLVTHPGVRQLTSSDLDQLERRIPLKISDLERSISAYHREDGNGTVRLGDAIAWLTKRARIPECASCGRRRRALNRIVIWCRGRRNNGRPRVTSVG